MILPVRDKRHLLEFIRLPEQIYHDDPDWVKPLIGADPKEFRPSLNPALKHHDWGLFLSLKDTVPVGRIAVFVDRQHNLIHNEKTAFFGFFECINDQGTATDLLSAAEDFAVSRGMDKITGPVNFSMNYQAGLLVDGSGRPTVMTPYNKKYYSELVEMAGYRKLVDLYAYNCLKDTPIPARIRKTVQMVCKRRQEITVKPFSELKGIKMPALITKLYNESFADTWGYIPMTLQEFAYLVKNINSTGVSDLNYIAFADGVPAGLLLTVPDIYSTGGAGNTQNHRLHAVYGKLRLTVLGVLPAFRKRGLETVLGLRLLDDAFKKGYEDIEFSVVLENNPGMNSIIDRFSLPVSKTYRLYIKQFS